MKRFGFSILAIIFLHASSIAVVNAAESVRVRNDTGALITVTLTYGSRVATRKEDIRPGSDYAFPYTVSNKSASGIHVQGRAINVPRKNQWVCGVSGVREGTYTVTVSAGRCTVR